jgi:hypothetical protein
MWLSWARLVETAVPIEHRHAFGDASQICAELPGTRTQVEVLRQLRHSAHQYVHVEHVHVNDGGQAVIGNAKKDGGLSRQ